MVIDRTKPQQSSGGSDFDLLETDTYVMEIASAQLEEDQFAEPNDNGDRPLKLVIRWEEVESGTPVWQRFNPYYGTTKDGAPSKFMAFLDGLAEQGLIKEQCDVETDLVGIKQRVVVEKYTKTMGTNKGKPGNKVTSVLPLQRARPQSRRNVPQPAPAAPVAITPATQEDEDADMPF